MRIMFCLGSLGIGGAERVITNLANTFIKENEVSIVVSTPKDNIYKLDEKIRFEVIDSLEEKNKIKKIFHRIKKTKELINEKALFNIKVKKIGIENNSITFHGLPSVNSILLKNFFSAFINISSIYF